MPFFINKDKIEIEITTACNLNCLQCDRSCPQAYSDRHMSLEQIRYFIDESIKLGKKWPFIVLIGGEPTMHPDIFEICKLFIEYKKNFSPNTKITISTNGASPETKEILSKLPYIIHQENSSLIPSRTKKFDTFNVAPIDIEKYQSPEINFSKGCCIPSLAGTALTSYGFYPCGAGAGIDRVTGQDIGIKSIKARTGMALRNQMNTLCRYCGHFKNKQDDTYSLNDISPTWTKLYNEYEKKRPELTRYGECSCSKM